MSGDDTARLVYFAILLLAVSGAVVAGLRRNPSRTMQQGLIWGLIFLAAIAAYGLWPEIRRAVLPRSATEVAGGVQLSAAGDGHFYVDAEVNGRSVTFLIDTGASDIVLSADDARRAGLDPATLSFTGQASTANGMVATAPVRLDSLTIGPWTDQNVRASVNQGALDKSLLGMSYLGRYRISVEGRTMRLSR